MVIAVDFDGTIVKHKYPAIGKEIPYAIKALKLFQERGHRLILWTYRAGRDLEKAVEFCEKRGLFFYAVNNNFEGEEFDGTYSRKIYADLYIDDRNILGLPDWKELYETMNNEDSEKAKEGKSKF
ncbi:hydrolase [Maribellus comscasis]|uniref:Hydrolase n=1 Tax=Maribellus comscasis TaxID=2681766 RepID=A0A6I6JN98_9BACT|nr:hydrolase [Maribellus comscasis]QGY43911.1 hydrolase [Maribellus comscasis]